MGTLSNLPSISGTNGQTLTQGDALWIRHPFYSTATAQVINGRGRQTNTSSVAYYRDVVPGNADQTSRVGIHSASAGGAAPSNALGPCVRMHPTSANMIYGQYVATESGQTKIHLFKLVNNTPTELGGTGVVVTPPSVGNVNDLELTVSGVSPNISLTLSYPGVSPITHTLNDTNFDSAGYTGMRFGFSADAPTSTTGAHMATFFSSDTTSSGITGTIAATETGSDAAALAGTVQVSGTIAAAETGSDVAALTGNTTGNVTGTIAAEEAGADVAALTGTVPVAGTVDAAEAGSDVAALTGNTTGGITGTITAEEVGADVATLVGTVPIVGSIAAAGGGSDTAIVSGFIIVPGTITSAPLVDINETLHASVSLDWVTILHAATGYVVLDGLTGITTNSSGIFSITHAALIVGDDYSVSWRQSTGESGSAIAAAT